MKIKPYAFVSAVKYCVFLAWRSSAFYTVTRIICSLSVPVTTITTAYLGKLVLDCLTGNNTSDAAQTLIVLFSLLMGVSIVKLVIQRLDQYCQVNHDELLNAKISLIIMEQGLAADISCYDNAEYYNKLTSASRDSGCIPMVLWNAISCFSACVGFVVAFIILSQESPLYGIILLVAGIPSAFTATRFAKSLYNLSLSQIEGERKKSYLNYISMAKDYAQNIRFYNIGEYLKQKYITVWESLFNERRKALRIRAIITGILGCLPEIVLVLISVDIAFKILADTATIGDYSLYTGLAVQLWSGIYVLSSTVTQIYDNYLKINNFRSLTMIMKTVLDNGTCRLENVDIISFDNVCFTYPDAKNPALQYLSFDVDKGEKVVLVGLNGSGKSTIIKLLMRFYDVDSGAIKINGINIKEYEISSIRKQFSVYFQDERNYSFTLRENIAIADTEAVACDEVEQAICESGGERILRKAPFGLDTYLYKVFSNDGMELSGGQHQKIALARTFFRRHSALILDEPSSNLDPKAEHELFENLRRFTNGKTTIFTSHRLSNTYLADRIIVIENGRLLETGTHVELLKKDGRYAELFRYQQEKHQQNTNK